MNPSQSDPAATPGHLDSLLKGVGESIAVKQAILSDPKLLPRLAQLAAILVDAFRNGNRVILAGNGGSAADAQHIAAEFVSRFEFDRPPLPALSLATDTSMLTAIGNDYGYPELFARQLQAQGRAGDVFIGITTSGRSENVLAAARLCKSRSIYSVLLTGNQAMDENAAEMTLQVPSRNTARIQEAHILLGHLLCREVESALFDRPDSHR